MKNERGAELQALAATLDSIIENPNAEAAIVPGNGPNESILIGSADSFLRLAKTLIELVHLASNRATWPDSDMEEETIEGVQVVGSNQIKEAFRESSPIWPMCAYLAPDDNRAKELTQKLAELTVHNAVD